MQVSLLTTATDSKPKPAITPSEAGDNGSSGAFFAQINQIWESGEEPDRSPDGEKSTEPGQAEAVGTLTVASSSPREVTAYPPASDEALVISMPGAAFLPDHPALISASGDPPANPAFSGTATDLEPAAITIPDDSVPAGQSGAKAPDEQAAPQIRQPGEKDAVRLGNNRDLPEKTRSGSAHSPKTVPGEASDADSAPGIGVETAAAESRPARIPLLESSRALESLALKGNGGAGDEPVRANAQPAAVAGRSGVFESEGIAHTGTPDSGAGQDNPAECSVASVATHDRPEQPKMNSMGTTSRESSPEASVQLASGPGHARLADTGSPQVLSKQETAPAQPREFVFQLAERITVQLRDGKREIHIQLRPDSLGRLDIRAENSVNGVVARIVAESADTKNYLESNLHLLQRTLEDLGLKIDRVHVSLQESFGSSSFPGFAAESGRSGSGPAGQEAARSQVTPGALAVDQVEEVVVDPAPWASANPNVRFHAVA